MIKGRQLVGLSILLHQSLDAGQPVIHSHSFCQRQRRCMGRRTACQQIAVSEDLVSQETARQQPVDHGSLVAHAYGVAISPDCGAAMRRARWLERLDSDKVYFLAEGL